MGHQLALWLFGLLMLMRGAIRLGSIFNGHAAANSADGIPLDTYTAAQARAVLSTIALLSAARLVVTLLGLLELLRYRTQSRRCSCCLLLEQLGRSLVQHIAQTDAPPAGMVNLVFPGVLVARLSTRSERRCH